jgi:nitroimidazol reductase NimA-like FMN-containing flavoprotein (pyridoxamine 5'-phosphate oxidase superfamily)
MPSRRHLIRMTDEEIRAYLASRQRIILVTNGAAGMPHAVPMDYGLDGEGRVLMTSFRKSQKVRNLERDPRATLLVESGAAYHELKSVLAYCDVEIIDDSAQVRNLFAMIRAGRNEAMAASINEGMTAQLEASIAKRVVLRFTPFGILSWDHAKLGAVY